MGYFMEKMQKVSFKKLIAYTYKENTIFWNHIISSNVVFKSFDFIYWDLVLPDHIFQSQYSKEFLKWLVL